MRIIQPDTIDSAGRGKGYVHKLSARKIRIDMIPLLDIIFILLIFLILEVVSLTVRRGLELEIPKGAGGIIPESITLEIDQYGTIVFEGNRVTSKQASEMVMAKQPDSRVPIIIRGDERSRLGNSIDLLSSLQEAGLDNIYFEITEDE
ncbi:MAG: hypothetical protein E4H36_13105 [Spirochaetales bacterium]|nr:MAG: hypothetical protein E4H36_13105 [Spirochaetales bacterium]